MLLIEFVKKILKEDFNRNAFVIDDKGVFHKVKYHGEIVYKFKYLLDTAESMFGDKTQINRAAISGNKDLLQLIDAAGFIRGGIWSPSKHELYFNWFKPTNKAKIGVINYIAKYKPKLVFVEDERKHKFLTLDIEQFIEDYL